MTVEINIMDNGPILIKGETILTKGGEKIEVKFREEKKVFDPKKIYKDEPNPTKL